ncbi:MAG: BON domain-containing protein [Actinomycetota bacterium]|nr:BON domain-containing protein [Actinomycetota bacterium]
MTGRGLTALVAGAAGAAAAYFLDPDRGRSRRVRACDQAAAAMRRRNREMSSQARYAEGQMEGAKARAAGGGTFTPEDDIDIVHAVRQALARLEFRTSDVNIDVVDGVASLRGQVERAAQIEEVTQAVSRVRGVAEVQSYLHTPGTPAPNKAASLKVS